MGNIIEIANDGQHIIRTNFWQTEETRKGAIMCSINAGCFRILLPENIPGIGKAQQVLREMRTGTEVKISRGMDRQLREFGFDFLFDDGSENPFFLIIAEKQFIATLPTIEDGGRDDLTVRVYAYNSNKCEMFEALELPARYRNVDTIPACEPWKVKTQNPAKISVIKPDSVKEENFFTIAQELYNTLTNPPKVEGEQLDHIWGKLLPLSPNCTRAADEILKVMSEALAESKPYGIMGEKNSATMPIYVEPSTRFGIGTEFIAMQTTECNGDIAKEPAIIFSKVGDRIYPLMYQNDMMGVCYYALERDSSGTLQVAPEMMVYMIHQQASQWLNIAGTRHGLPGAFVQD